MTIAADVSAAVEHDLRNLLDARVRASIESLRLPTPRRIQLAWDYGAPGETFDGWLVLDDPRHDTGIVYCDNGFGPLKPWGLIHTHVAVPTMGIGLRMVPSLHGCLVRLVRRDGPPHLEGHSTVEGRPHGRSHHGRTLVG